MSTSVVPVSGAESARKLKVSSLASVPAVSRIGATLIRPMPACSAAPVEDASTSTTRQAPSATFLARVRLAATINPARVYSRHQRPRLIRMKLRDLPSVDELARDERLPAAVAARARDGARAPEPPALVVAAARSALARAREEIKAGDDPGDLVE